MRSGILLLLTLPLLAQVESVRVYSGDDVRWADPLFDDVGWPRKLDSSGTRSWARYRVRVPDRILDPVIGIESTTMEVYVDGQLVGRHGSLPPRFEDSARGYATFVLPPESAVPGRIITVALRIWDPPGFRFRPERTAPPALLIHSKGETPIHERQSLAGFRGHAWSAALAIFVLFLVILAGRTQEKGREFALAAGSWAAFAAYELVSVASFYLPCSRASYLTTIGIGVFVAVTPVELAALMAAFKPTRWMRLGQATFVCAQLALLAANAHFEAPRWTPLAGYFFLTAGFIPPLVITEILARRISKDAGARRLLLLLTFALGCIAYARLANVVGLPSQLSILGADLAVNILGFALFGFSLTAVTLLQFRKAIEMSARLQGQLAAARNVQEMLLTGTVTASPGYSIEVEYLPAAEVGGDFFRVLPAPGGATLVVIGDVSGKGLRAAMVVCVIVGVLLNRHSSEPAEVLADLNRAIAGHLEGGFVTCCAALFEPDSRVTIANAGHPPPYCGGKELDLPVELPLGVVSDASYESTTLQLSGTDQILLLSDGIIEAENPRRELFGFERARLLSNRPAQEIAAAAKAWGQTDDISVLTVRHNYTLAKPGSLTIC